MFQFCDDKGTKILFLCQTRVAPFGARATMFLSPHATRVFDPRAMGLPQVKAAGLVQVFDLLRLQHRAAPCITDTGCATSCHACIIVTRLASP